MTLSYTELYNFIDQLDGVYTPKYIRADLFKLGMFESKWLNWEYNHRSPPTIDDSITYGDCVDTTFEIQAKNIIVRHVVWDGELMDGRRTTKRCEYKFLLMPTDYDMLEFLEQLVLRELRLKAVDKFHEMEEERMKKQTDEIYRRFLVTGKL